MGRLYKCGESRLIYGDLYMVVIYDEGYIFPIKMSVTYIWIGPTSPYAFYKFLVMICISPF
jgi:hypothetical protein